MQLSHRDLKIKTVSESATRGVFEFDPLPKGFGYTLGNTLRRVLLTSLEGAAITQIKVSGITHQFSALKGVKEDLVEIILNLKQVRFKMHVDNPVVATLKASGSKKATAKNIEVPSDLEVLNKDLHIATLAEKSAKLNIELVVERGVGYSPMEERQTSKVGVIVIDALFSPVTRVQIDVKETRAGGRTDLDKLILNIETDGSIKPSDAMYNSAGIVAAFFKEIKTWEHKEEIDEEEVKKEEVTLDPRMGQIAVEELPLQTRTINALKKADIGTLAEIAEKSEEELSDIKNLGEKSIIEINKLLVSEGLR
ncbi:DNA-directed RNA polymerase subunit alpha [Patescibacteria group bacterium]